ncbi:hypothetical protein ABBQ38_014162 [Trebouxia sp. C0009 RCD-2024]
MPGLPLQQEQEAVAFLQKTASADGGSLYDHMTDIVMKAPPDTSNSAAISKIYGYVLSGFLKLACHSDGSSLPSLTCWLFA